MKSRQPNTSASLGSRFLDSTRGQIVSLLRRSARTVDDLAVELVLTRNAIRNHLATLERDGIVRQDGVRRGPGAGKPAVVYELHPDAEPLLSSAYAPVLRTLVDVLVAELPAAQADALLLKLGHQLAAGAGGRAQGDLPSRVKAAAAVLTSLGGDVEITEENGALRIRGCACPVAATVSDHPEVCRAVETLVGDVTGERVRSQCDYSPRPRCCFVIGDDAQSG